MVLKIPIDPVALTEALPFLVCTVGFDKPLRLAAAVFGHEHLLLPPGVEVPSKPSGNTPSTVSNFQPVSSHYHHQLKPAPKIITESLSLVYAPIIRDYILEIAVLTVGAYSKVGGLKEVCALAALILAVDCLLLCTYLAAILGVMVEVSDTPFFAFNLRMRGFALVSVLFLDLTVLLSFSSGFTHSWTLMTPCTVYTNNLNALTFKPLWVSSNCPVFLLSFFIFNFICIGVEVFCLFDLDLVTLIWGSGLLFLDTSFCFFSTMTRLLNSSFS
jgi:hypothetical protein